MTPGRKNALAMVELDRRDRRAKIIKREKKLQARLNRKKE